MNRSGKPLRHGVYLFRQNEPPQEAGHQFEWEEIKRDLKALQRITVEEDGRRLAVRTACSGACGKIFQAVGVALPPTISEA